jgi:hypothetical protein
MGSSLKVKSAYLSFLNAFYVPTNKIRAERFLDFHDPNNYYGREVPPDGDPRKSALRPERLYVNGVGEFRSVYKPNNMKESAPHPESDSIWNSIGAVYSTASRVGEKLSFLPCLPSIIDYLPSKQRTYALDLSGLSGTLSTITGKQCRMSISMYYFPVGWAVSRVGIFLQAEDYSIDAIDLVPLFRLPSKIAVTIHRSGGEKRHKPPISGNLTSFVGSIEKRFLREICGSPDDGSSNPSVNSRYSIVDLVDTLPKVDAATNKDVIFSCIQSEFIDDQNSMPANISRRLPTADGAGMERGITIFGERFGFSWMPPTIATPLSIRYRRQLRILTMLTLIQMGLNVNVTSLEQMSWRDQIKSKEFVQQMKRGIMGPAIVWPLSFMHYLRVQHSFDSDEVRKQMYDDLRTSIDRRKLIDATTVTLKKHLDEVQDEVKNSASAVSGLVSQLISHLP